MLRKMNNSDNDYAAQAVDHLEVVELQHSDWWLQDVFSLPALHTVRIWDETISMLLFKMTY